MNLVLYTGPHCSLCDSAQDLIYDCLPTGHYNLEKIDVTKSLELKKKYGLRIPVLGIQGCELELAWPFNEFQLVQFCQSNATFEN